MTAWLAVASHQPKYEQMILGVYATLGVFLPIAPEHRSLIAFTAWSSLVHAGPESRQ